MDPAGVNTFVNHLRRTLCARELVDVSDSDLLERFVAWRDDAAFAALVRRHGPMVWGVCRRLLTHQHDAEDAFQAAFLVLVRRAHAIGRRELLAPWLFGVARRAALNARARRARRAEQERACGDVLDAHPASDPPPDDGEAVLDEELARLPEKYRLPLLLCGLEGLTHAEAAARLGWPTGTVAGRLSRGRALLRTRLLRRGVTTAVAALAGALGQGETLADVPPQLAAATTQSAASLGTAGVAAHVLALAHGVLWKMSLSRFLVYSAGSLLLAVALAGVGAAWYRTPAGTPDGPAWAMGRPPPASTGKPDLRLPDDPNAVVLALDRETEPPTAACLSLKVFANGRARVEVREGDPEDRKVKVHEGNLSTPELLDLVRFAVHEQKFFDFDPVEVRATLRNVEATTGVRARYQADGKLQSQPRSPDVRLRVRTANRDHDVYWEQPGNGRFLFPELKRLEQLGAVERRLRQVAAVLQVGGPQRAESLLHRANEFAWPFYRDAPNLPRLTVQDLIHVAPLANEPGMRVTFLRYQGRGGLLFSVVIDVPEQGEPRLFSAIPPQQEGSPSERLGAAGS